MVGANSPLLSVTGVSKWYGAVHALDQVSFSVHASRVHCLAGENGSGKSTLIKIISGIEGASEGRVSIGSADYPRLTPRLAIHHGIQVIYQDLSIFPNLSVAENIALGNDIASRRRVVKAARTRQIATRALKLVNAKLPLDVPAGELSIAQRQLIAICRALAQDTKILFMDEPTTALTRPEVTALFSVVRRLRDSGVGVVLVTHKLNEVFDVADDISVLRNGSIVAQGGVDEFDRVKLATAMVGAPPKAHNKRQRPEGTSEPALAVKGLSLEGEFSDVSLVVHKGEVVGLSGILGSGREAVADALFGVRRAHSGDILINGRKVELRNVRDALRHGIGSVPGDRLSEGLFVEHSIAQNTVSATIGTLARRFGLVTGAVVNRAGQDAVEEFAIKTPTAKAAVRTLSGGNQQRVVLAKWIRRRPVLLILNGPTVGVDIGSKREIISMIRELADAGMAMLMISDDVTELVEACDRVLMMRNGRVATELSGRNINESNLVAELVQ